MNDLRTAAQQALEALEWHLDRGTWGADIEGVTGALRAALARIEWAEPVQETCPGCEATLGAACGRESCPKGWEAAPQPQQAEPGEPDHETRAELAEQQVVQLAEERDHYRSLWQKAQQAEAVEPVAWMYPDDYAGILKHQSRAEVFQKAWCNPAVCVPFYTAPPQRKPLTEEEIRDLWSWAITAEAERTATTQQHAFARAIERAHGIGKGA